MSSDINADAGYSVLSMSKNTTYFELLSVTVAMIPRDWSRAVGVFGSSSGFRYSNSVSVLR